MQRTIKIDYSIIDNDVKASMTYMPLEHDDNMDIRIHINIMSGTLVNAAKHVNVLIY